MEINRSGATFSSIVGIGEHIANLKQTTGQEYLLLNRGVNAVCNIDLTEVIKQIDFNANRIQVYPANRGLLELRKAINEDYFNFKSDPENISITAGGMSALDLAFQVLKIETLYFSKFFWGSYAKVSSIRGIRYNTYEDLSNFISYVECNIKDPSKIAVIVCDPNNPLGNKLNDNLLIRLIEKLNNMGVTIIFDCPYRKLFHINYDPFFEELLKFKGVIITESFSKSLGLSGQRIGFIHTQNEAFNSELNIRLIYSLNGVNAFAQELVYQLLSSESGRKAVAQFKKNTTQGIKANINYLKHHKLLADELYVDSEPMGIFSVITMTQEDLLKHNIGSVSMNYFCKEKSIKTGNLSRICVSVPPEKFEFFFNLISKERKLTENKTPIEDQESHSPLLYNES